MSATDFELYTEIEWTGVKIKECPFCGSAGQLYQYKAGPNVYQKVVMCTNGGSDDENGECPMYMPPEGFYCATKKEAIQRWNKRANSDEHGEERDQLREKLHELASAVRSVNRGKQHMIMVDGDDQPCFWQRKEWIDWIIELANNLEAGDE